MMRPSAAVLVLLPYVILMSSWPRSNMVTALWDEHLESSFANRMALFQHVLLNDLQWSPVLKQKFKLSAFSPPKYTRFNSNDEYVNKIELITENDDQNPTAMYVLQKLMNNSSLRSGTNVNFTAYVLSTAVTCFTYSNVSFVLMLIVHRIGMLAHKMTKTIKNNDDKKEEKETDVKKDKNKKPYDEMDIKKALDLMRLAFNIFIDKVATVDGELTFFATALYDLENAHEARPENDLIVFKVLEKVKEEVDKRLNLFCLPTPHTEVYQYLGKYETLKESLFRPDELTPNDDTLKLEVIEFKKVIDCMIKVYDELDVETMSMDTWLLILNYESPISMNIKLDVDEWSEKPIPPNPEKYLSHRLMEAITEEEKKEEAAESSKSLEGKSDEALDDE